MTVAVDRRPLSKNNRPIGRPPAATCSKGHPRTAEYIYVSPNGKVHCQPCRAKSTSAHESRRKQRRHDRYAAAAALVPLFHPNLSLYLRARISVNQETGCWHWTGPIDENGYGLATGKGYRPRKRAHRATYEATVGTIPAGLTLDHLCHSWDSRCEDSPCRHRRCVNPAHLEAVTAKVNSLRGRSQSAVNGRKEACKRGHRFTPDNTYTAGNHRKCRRCALDHARQTRIAKQNRACGRQAS